MFKIVFKASWYVEEEVKRTEAFNKLSQKQGLNLLGNHDKLTYTSEEEG